MKRVVSFGEVMLRLCPPGGRRLAQATSFEVEIGGAEANVAVALAQLGVDSAFVSLVPDGPLGDLVVQRLRGLGVDTTWVSRSDGRLGLYFLEQGAAQRPSSVVYDRSGSAMAKIAPGTVDWAAALKAADWLHVSGITPALSAGAADAALEAVTAARDAAKRVSVDLNYRAALWRWGKTAGAVMGDLVSAADVLIANEEDADRVFGLRPDAADGHGGSPVPEAYASVAAALFQRFASLGTIAFTLRGAISASHNTWSGVLFGRDGGPWTAPVYEILPIVDRVGSGDAFAGGLIAALLDEASDPGRAVAFATAAGALKHSVPGDLPIIGRHEVERLVAGDASGRIVR
jgi:2-dehydro-3-deoxygluconokinase